MKVPVEKPGSPEEILVHFGKKGMKWGQRKEVSRNANAAFNKANPTSRKRTKAIKSARLRQVKREADIHLAKRGEQRANAKRAFLHNPDRAVSLRLTRGEKIVAAILIAPTPVGAAVSGTIAARVASRHRAERRAVSG